MLDAASRQHLFQAILAALDSDNAADLETFARNFLHKAEVWDLLADRFPDAKASEVRAAMMEAFAAWQQGQPASDGERRPN